MIDIDERDLAILQLASIGLSDAEIARAFGVRLRTVRRVTAADAAAFPDEPLAARAMALQPGGTC